VQVLTGGDPNLGTDSTHVGNNNITGSGIYCIWNRNAGGSPQVQAYGNYFGACSGGTLPTCWSGSVNVNGGLCADPLDVNVPYSLVSETTGLRMLGAIPNPTRGPGVIHFRLDKDGGHVGIRIFDVTGRLVRDFGSLEGATGDNEIPWDGRDTTGRAVRSGLYFVRISLEGSHEYATGKVLVAR